MIKPEDTLKNEIGFSWIDNDGIYHCWMTDRMIKHANRHLEPCIIEMDADYAQWVRDKNGIEYHRLIRITPQVIAQLPVIYIEMGDGTHKLVDGNHRYLKAYQLGWKELPAYLFPKALADDFKVDIPPEMNEICKRFMPGFSGIL